MKEIKKYLDHTFQVISAINVHGNDVELMAEARETLRRAYKEAEEKEKRAEEEKKKKEADKNG